MSIRVVIADDSSLMRRIIISQLEKDPEIRVLAAVEDGSQVLKAVQEYQPDVLVLDLEMPVMDGIQALGEVRQWDRRLPVIMFSTLTHRGAEATIKALVSGASDYVGKPSQLGSADEAMQVFETLLIPKIKALAKKKASQKPALRPTSEGLVKPIVSPSPGPMKEVPSNAVQAVCIGVSTGGPVALVSLFERWKTPLSVPIFLVQHMPPRFTEKLANRLSELGSILVSEPYDGEEPKPGHAYLAPGGWHMLVEKRFNKIKIRLNEEPPVNSCRPSVDLLFRSAAEVYQSDLLGVVMTGMGNDGLQGSRRIVELGGSVIAQDEETSTVWGMPGSVAQAGLAYKLLPLDDIAAEVVQRVNP